MNGNSAYESTQEVRLALVMYGGVSLAIYINGVAQEMLRVVRATAPDALAPLPAADDERPPSTEAVYRRLGQLAGRLEEERGGPVERDAPIRTRFVVDVISGTSAGGINGLYLGKALANGQRLDQLKKLWIDEGDIRLLLNDAKSVEAPLQRQDPPQSLLNSQRMYAKLLAAFNGMDERAGAGTPLADELDVFVTATDVEGLVVPLRLADKLVYERRHENVFHFAYTRSAAAGAEDANDFVQENNPFLAFAARCTSAFPFAFEPMTLADIDPVLEVTPPFAGKPDCGSGAARWRKFFPSYLRALAAAPAQVPFPHRSFGDGGYLDNKPFSYALDALVKRHAAVHVERKLIYVEPAPEHPEREAPRRAKPDALENSLAALIKIPAYETIREDLQRVLERNRDMERVKRLLAQIERDLEEAGRRGEPTRRPELKPGEWVKLDVAEMHTRFGPAYVAYNRLKVSSVTDDLVSMLARLYEFDERSSVFQAVRCLVRAWRDRNYLAYCDRATPGEGGAPTQNQFLMDFDAAYRLRRIRFVLNKIDDLWRLDALAVEMLRFRGQSAWVERAAPETATAKAEFRRELTAIKTALLPLYRRLQDLERQLWPSWRQESPLLEAVGALGISLDDLYCLLGVTSAGLRDGEGGCLRPAEAPFHEEECTQRAREFLAGNRTAREWLDGTADRLRGLLRAVWSDPAAGAIVQELREPGPTPPAAAARATLRHYFDRYEDYDLVLFPILFQTDVVGEGAAVGVIRISPEDAGCLNDVLPGSTGSAGKLAGAALGHFGGFLETEWRRNDMMWGRLDAAERLITASLPDARDEADRRLLIDEAHKIILREELSDGQRSSLYDRLAATGATPDTLAFAKRILLDEKEALRDYCEKLDREPNPKGALRALARATQVVGKMLEGLAQRRQVEVKRLALVARLGRLFWGLVEVALPRSLPQLLFSYWLQLVYAFAAALVVAGLTFSSAEVQRVGWRLLAATAAVHLAAGLLGDYMRRKTSTIAALKTLLVFGVLGFAAFGAFEAWRIVGEGLEWWAVARTPPEYLVRALGTVGALMALLGLWMNRHARSLDFVGRGFRTSSGIQAPILAMQVPESSHDVFTVAGGTRDPDRETLAEIQKADFAFIALYWLLFGGLSWLMVRNDPAMLPLAVGAFGCGTAAAGFDVFENLRILELLSVPLPRHRRKGDELQSLVDRTRRAALAKWALVWVTLLLLSRLFFALGGWWTAPGIWFVVSAVAGLGGLWRRKWLELASAIMGLGVVALAALLLAHPGWFLR